jgi:tetratricopeptide (TPR) repeat protein
MTTQLHPSASPRLAEARQLAMDAKSAGARGDPQKALDLYDRALALLDAGPRDRLLADVLRWKGTLHRDRGETWLAQQLYERSLQVATDAGFDVACGHALNCLGIIAQRRGDMDRAEELYGGAARCADDLEDDELRGMAGQNRGVLANIRGDHPAAMAHYTESLAGFAATGNDEATSWVLNNLGMLHMDAKRFDLAKDTFDRAFEIAQRRGDRRMLGLIQLNVAEHRLAVGDLDDAEVRVGEVLRMAAERGDAPQCSEAFKLRGQLELRRGNLDGADASLRRARELAEGIDDALLIAEILRETAEVAYARGERDRAMAVLRQSRGGFRELGATPEAAQTTARLTLIR